VLKENKETLNNKTSKECVMWRTQKWEHTFLGSLASFRVPISTKKEKTEPLSGEKKKQKAST